MGGISSFFLTIILVLFLYGMLSMLFNRGVVHLSLSKFILDPDNEDQIIIEGRKTGLWQWILVQLRLGNIYKIHVHKTYISYSEDSARGKVLTLAPIHKIASTSSGYRKPIGLLILGAFLALIGFFGLFLSGNSYNVGSAIGGAILMMMLGGLCVFLYIYKKNFVITIETMGSQRFGFSFKRSFIENVPIDIEKIEAAIHQINKLVIESK